MNALFCCPKLGWQIFLPLSSQGTWDGAQFPPCGSEMSPTLLIHPEASLQGIV